jgi:multicomponent Na+:H+ antiporter subunit G
VGLVSELLIVAGAAWSVIAAIGMWRFDDIYARMHAATKTTTLGMLLILCGAAVSIGGLDAAKLLLAGVLLFMTAPIGAHLVGRAVHFTAEAQVRIDTIDELRDARSTPEHDPEYDSEHD